MPQIPRSGRMERMKMKISDGNIDENCPPTEIKDLGFEIEGTGFCLKDVIGGGQQIAEAGFEIDFNEVLDGDELFDFALVGDGKGGDFDLLQQGLIARDANGEVITEGSPVSLDGEVAGNGTNYLGRIKISAGVKRVDGNRAVAEWG